MIFIESNTNRKQEKEKTGLWLAVTIQKVKSCWIHFKVRDIMLHLFLKPFCAHSDQKTYCCDLKNVNSEL